MLAAAICFVSVLSTASLASFGTDQARLLSTPSHLHSGASITGADEDVVRMGRENGGECLLFHEFFAAVAIMVSIVYYVIVKATLLAMGAVIMVPPNPHPMYASDEDDDSGASLDDTHEEGGEGRRKAGGCSSSSSSVFSVSESDSGGDDESVGKEESYVFRNVPRADDITSTAERVPQCEMEDCNFKEIAAAPEKTQRHAPQGNQISKALAINQADEISEALAINQVHEISEALAINQADEISEALAINQADGITAAPARKQHGECRPQRSRRKGHAKQEEDTQFPSADRRRPDRPRLHRRSNDSFEMHLLHEDGAEQSPARPGDAPQQGGMERFNAVKIWTNIYGLSIGIYCLVYSLLLPNELSAFVFCLASLLAGIHEAVLPCLQVYLGDEADYEAVIFSSGSVHAQKGPARARRKRAAGSTRSLTQRVKRCMGWICLVQSSVAQEIKESARRSLRRSRQALSRSVPFRKGHDSPAHTSTLLGSGILVMPCIVVLMVLGLVTKGLEAATRKKAAEMEMMASMEALNATWLADAGPVPLFQGTFEEPDTGEDSTLGSGHVQVARTAVNVLFPVVGVLMLKSMMKTDNVRETIELAVPVCALNSLSIVCIIMVQGSSCLLKNLSYSMGMDPSHGQGQIASNRLPWTNQSSTDRLPTPSPAASAGDGAIMVLRYQPILAALALPFPLVCSIVCIVAAVRNRRVMVSQNVHVLGGQLHATYGAIYPWHIWGSMSRVVWAVACNIWSNLSMAHMGFHVTCRVGSCMQHMVQSIHGTYGVLCRAWFHAFFGAHAQDVAVSIYLAYASRPFHSSMWLKDSSEAKDASARYMMESSLAMGSLGQVYAFMVCLALAAYRMSFGDDHGHASHHLLARRWKVDSK
jgi:hypothetical protein